MSTIIPTYSQSFLYRKENAVHHSQPPPLQFLPVNSDELPRQRDSTVINDVLDINDNNQYDPKEFAEKYISSDDGLKITDAAIEIFAEEFQAIDPQSISSGHSRQNYVVSTLVYSATFIPLSIEYDRHATIMNAHIVNTINKHLINEDLSVNSRDQIRDKLGIIESELSKKFGLDIANKKDPISRAWQQYRDDLLRQASSYSQGSQASVKFYNEKIKGFSAFFQKTVLDPIKTKIDTGGSRWKLSRGIGTFFASPAIMSRIFGASQADNGDSKRTETIAAVQYMLSATQVPSSYINAAFDAAKAKSINGKISVKSFKQELRAAINEGIKEFLGIKKPIDKPVDIDQKLTFGKWIKRPDSRVLFGAHLNKIQQLDANAQKAISEKRHIGRGTPFVATDFATLVASGNALAAAIKQEDYVSVAALLAGIVGDTSFVVADIIDVFRNKGQGKLAGITASAARGAAAFYLVMGIISFAKSIEQVSKNPTPVNIGAAVDASLDLVGSIGAVVGTFAPPVALAITLFFLFKPNAASIARAVEIAKQIAALEAQGLSSEAAVLRVMHTEAALDATPIVNWFSAIYSKSLENQIQAKMNGAWYNNVFVERLINTIKSGQIQKAGDQFLSSRPDMTHYGVITQGERVDLAGKLVEVTGVNAYLYSKSHGDNPGESFLSRHFSSDYGKEDWNGIPFTPNFQNPTQTQNRQAYYPLIWPSELRPSTPEGLEKLVKEKAWAMESSPSFQPAKGEFSIANAERKNQHILPNRWEDPNTRKSVVRIENKTHLPYKVDIYASGSSTFIPEAKSKADVTLNNVEEEADNLVMIDNDAGDDDDTYYQFTQMNHPRSLGNVKGRGEASVFLNNASLLDSVDLSSGDDTLEKAGISVLRFGSQNNNPARPNSMRKIDVSYARDGSGKIETVTVTKRDVDGQERVYELEPVSSLVENGHWPKTIDLKLKNGPILENGGSFAARLILDAPGSGVLYVDQTPIPKLNIEYSGDGSSIIVNKDRKPSGRPEAIMKPYGRFTNFDTVRASDGGNILNLKVPRPDAFSKKQKFFLGDGHDTIRLDSQENLFIDAQNGNNSINILNSKNIEYSANQGINTAYINNSNDLKIDSSGKRSAITVENSRNSVISTIGSDESIINARNSDNVNLIGSNVNNNFVVSNLENSYIKGGFSNDNVSIDGKNNIIIDLGDGVNRISDHSYDSSLTIKNIRGSNTLDISQKRDGTVQLIMEELPIEDSKKSSVVIPSYVSRGYGDPLIVNYGNIPKKSIKTTIIGNSLNIYVENFPPITVYSNKNNANLDDFSGICFITMDENGDKQAYGIEDLF